ncbi:C-C motif chemokine 28-like isoform X2 [Sinocyclocheilus grahami]|uniref:C-C motif chemokine 28-like n=1 Tax=Sinocyclocheilus grahami TaxID=75366 RepID=A0A672NLW2_SINGR|nr:PREDICTED: C-C motif chemokine 28-like isoform X1 [Sinocyclocheilus grahami]XP_016110059.1 PREDICTED: C-C motif chemokine 28-like isoform X2 [Sinocyclocheilus grahami]
MIMCGSDRRSLTARIRVCIRLSDPTGCTAHLTDLQMELIVFGILLSVTFSTVQGITPKCCVEMTKMFPLEILRKVTKYEVQTNHGVCTINALVLHVKDKRYCATPRLERILQNLLKLKSRHSMKNTSAV